MEYNDLALSRAMAGASQRRLGGGTARYPNQAPVSPLISATNMRRQPVPPSGNEPVTTAPQIVPPPLFENTSSPSINDGYDPAASESHWTDSEIANATPITAQEINDLTTFGGLASGVVGSMFPGAGAVGKTGFNIGRSLLGIQPWSETVMKGVIDWTTLGLGDKLGPFKGPLTMGAKYLGNKLLGGLSANPGNMDFDRLGEKPGFDLGAFNPNPGLTFGTMNTATNSERNTYDTFGRSNSFLGSDPLGYTGPYAAPDGNNTSDVNASFPSESNASDFSFSSGGTGEGDNSGSSDAYGGEGW
jgi:hypothetical protein